MTHRHVVLLVLVLAGCGGGGGGPKVSLRYHPPAGAVYRFGIEHRTSMSADSGPMARLGKQEVIMRLYFTQSVKGAASGGTEIEVLFQTLTMEIPGVRADIVSRGLAGLQGMRGTMVIDERGKIVRSEFAERPGVTPEMAKRVASSISSMAVGFPDHPVGQGDSWTVSQALPLDDVPGISASASEAARTTLTVRELRVNGADTSVVLDVKTAFPTEPIRLTSAAGESVRLTLGGGMTGHQVFSLSRGTVTDGTMKGSMRMSFGGGTMGTAGMSMQTETENSIVLLPE